MYRVPTAVRVRGGGVRTKTERRPMRYRHIVICVALAAVVCGCGSRRASVPVAPSRYERPALREVSQEQLDEDSELIGAVSLQVSGHVEEALAAYSRLAERRPECAAAWYGMGRILLQRGWADSAMACVSRATALSPTNRWYLMLQGEVCGFRGDARGRIDAWERIVAADPSRLENYYELSNAYVMAGDVDRAVEVLDRVEKRVGISEPVSLQKQRLWVAAGKQDKAERELERLAGAMPSEKRYQAMMAEMNMNRGRYAKAKQYYDRVLAADPDDEYIHIQLAEYYKRIGQPEAADREMGLAFENRRLDCKTKVQLLAQFYTNEEFYGSRSATTFALLERAMQDCADSAQFALVYGDVLMRQRKYAEAARWLELSLGNDSSRYEVWEALLICLSEVPEREGEMLKVAARAERLFPMKTLPLYMQAIDAIGRKKYDEGLEKLEKAAKWGFLNGYLEAESYAAMAECHYRLGHYEQAWRAFDRSVALQPDNMGVLNNYAYYLSEQNLELEKAEAMSRRTIEAEPDNANSLDTYGWILHLMGRDGEARRYLEKAVRLDPKSDTLRRHLEAVGGGTETKRKP